MANFRYIDYAQMLYNTTTEYFSITKQRVLSNFYKYLYCIIQPLQAPFDKFDKWRKLKFLIVNCGWLIGQLTNFLNYLFPSTTSNKIYITQEQVAGFFIPTVDNFSELPIFIPTVDNFSELPIFVPTIDSLGMDTLLAIFHVPLDVSNSQLDNIIAVIEQIKISGVEYSIISY